MFLLQTHGNDREKTNVKIKDTVMLKIKMEIVRDKTMSRNNGKEAETADLWGFRSRKSQRKPGAQLLRSK